MCTIGHWRERYFWSSSNISPTLIVLFLSNAQLSELVLNHLKNWRSCFPTILICFQLLFLFWKRGWYSNMILNYFYSYLIKSQTLFICAFFCFYEFFFGWMKFFFSIFSISFFLLMKKWGVSIEVFKHLKYESYCSCLNFEESPLCFICLNLINLDMTEGELTNLILLTVRLRGSFKTSNPEVN